MKDYSGQRFGRLVAVRYDHTVRRDSKHHNTFWLCKCDCGNEKIASTSNLVAGKTKSCGCLHREVSVRNGKQMVSRGVVSLENDIIRGYKSRCKKMGRPWKLTTDQAVALLHSPCSYCGRMDKRKGYNTGEVFELNGIDRVDSSKGYTIDNVTPCCKQCNVAKNNYEKSDFLSWIRRVYENSIG